MQRLRRIWDSYWGRIGWSLLGLFVVIPAALRRFCIVQNYGEGVLVGTGIAVLWYTVETFSLRREMVRTNDIAIRPLILIQIRPVGLAPPDVILRNIGKGPALYVEVDDVRLRTDGDSAYAIRFQPVDVIEEKQEVAVDVSPVGGPFPAAVQSPALHLDPRTASRTYQVHVRYEDTDGFKRESWMQMGNDGIRLLRHT